MSNYLPELTISKKKRSFFQQLIQVLIIVIVVYAAAMTGGLGAGLVSTLGPAGLFVAAAAGYAIGYATSYVTQTLAIGAGLQKDYNRDAMSDMGSSFATTAIAGGITGGADQAWGKFSWQATAVRGLTAAGTQVLRDGKVTSWTGVFAAMLPPSNTDVKNTAEVNEQTGLANSLLANPSWGGTFGNFLRDNKFALTTAASVVESGLRDQTMHTADWASIASDALQESLNGSSSYRNGTELNWSRIGQDVLTAGVGALLVGGDKGVDAGVAFLGSRLGNVVAGAGNAYGVGRNLGEGLGIWLKTITTPGQDNSPIQQRLRPIAIDLPIDESGRVAGAVQDKKIAHQLIAPWEDDAAFLPDQFYDETGKTDPALLRLNALKRNALVKFGLANEIDQNPDFLPSVVDFYNNQSGLAKFDDPNFRLLGLPQVWNMETDQVDPESIKSKLILNLYGEASTSYAAIGAITAHENAVHDLVMMFYKVISNRSDAKVREDVIYDNMNLFQKAFVPIGKSIVETYHFGQSLFSEPGKLVEGASNAYDLVNVMYQDERTKKVFEHFVTSDFWSTMTKLDQGQGAFDMATLVGPGAIKGIKNVKEAGSFVKIIDDAVGGLFTKLSANLLETTKRLSLLTADAAMTAADQAITRSFAQGGKFSFTAERFLGNILAQGRRYVVPPRVGGIVPDSFNPAPKRVIGIDDIKVSSNGEIEILSKQKIMPDGSIAPNRFTRHELGARFNSESGDLYIDWYSTTQPGNKIGRELISNAIEAVGPRNVNTVTAQLGRDNLAAFDGLTRSGLNTVDAAANTPFGKALKDLGYKPIEVSHAPYRVTFGRQ